MQCLSYKHEGKLKYKLKIYINTIETVEGLLSAVEHWGMYSDQ